MTYSILNLLKEDEVKPRRVANTNGGEYASPCPGCGGKDRFRAWPSEGDGGRWWCRQCGKWGDLIQYLQDFRNMSFRDSCTFLGQSPTAFCKRLQNEAGRNEWKPVETSPPPNKWRLNATKLLKITQRHLWRAEGRRIRAWLRQRGLKRRTIRQSRLGWNPKDIYVDRKDWGLKEDGECSKIWIPGGLVIPCFRRGVIQRISVRRSMPRSFDMPPDRGGRYVLVSGSSGKVPMALGNDKKYFVVVESDLDAILLNQEAGDLVSLISLKSAANKPDGKTAILLRKAKTILVALDTDEAGKKSAWMWWMDQFPNSKRWPVPKGKDPGEAYKEGVDLKKWIRARLP